MPRNLYLGIVVNLKDCSNNFRITSTAGIKKGDDLALIIFVFFINAVGESISAEWERAGIEDLTIQYYKKDHPKEACHGHIHTTGVRQGESLAFFKSYYVDNSDFLTLSCCDAEKATSLIVKHFRRLGLKIHFGIISAGKAPKTETIFIPDRTKVKRRTARSLHIWLLTSVWNPTSWRDLKSSL